MGETRVKKRCVFFLGGYEPIAPQRQHERYIRELARSQAAWSVDTKVGPLQLSADGLVGSWRIEAQGPNWATQADYHSLLWSDIVTEDFGRPVHTRLMRAIAAFGDFILSGTALRYLAVQWRYGAFFLYPVLLLMLFALAGIFAGWFAAGQGVPLPLLTGSLAGIAVFSGLLIWPGRYLLLHYMMDDWIFGQEVVHRSRAGFEPRLQGFAEKLAEVLRHGGYDEIVFSGHSLGCALKVSVVDRALAMVPEFGQRGEQLHLLSTGSSLLKIALHPKAGWLREAVARVSAHPAIAWVEYQTNVDPISFYKVDPLEALKLPATGRPLVRRVHVRDMLGSETYRRFRGNFFRMHRQLVMGNEKRYFYDYYMVCCGPLFLKERVHHPETIVSKFAPDGALIEPDRQPSPAQRMTAHDA